MMHKQHKSDSFYPVYTLGEDKVCVCVWEGISGAQDRGGRLHATFSPARKHKLDGEP